jgi:hypothetical protein
MFVFVLRMGLMGGTNIWLLWDSRWFILGGDRHKEIGQLSDFRDR